MRSKKEYNGYCLRTVPFLEKSMHPGYIAGIFDAEGWTGYRKTSPCSSVEMACEPIVRYLHTQFKGSVSSRFRDNANKRTWAWTVQGNDQRHFQQTVQPYFLVKFPEGYKLPTDYEYLAGYFDGEGSITIRVNKNVKRPYHQLRCTMGTTDKVVLNLFKSVYGGSLYAVKKYHDHYKQKWQWEVSSKKALDFLLIVHPLLIEKQLQAETGIKFHRDLILPIKSSPGNPVPTVIAKQRDRAMQHLRHLKTP